MISWQTHEFEPRERRSDWVWYAGLIFAIGAILAFFYDNFFFGIFLCLAGALVVVFALRKPKELLVSFQEKGISINDHFIPFEKIKTFWIDETGKTDKLLLLVKGAVVPLLVLSLSGIRADTLREELKKYAPEEYLRESTGVKIFEYFGF